MSSSFIVNQADLAFILKQIQVSDLHAGTYGPAMSLTAAIQQVYGLSATDAALAPFGLRTVDGQDNNLLPGQGAFGAADNPFPRLTDPVFINDADGDKMPLGPFPAPVITNTNYGAPGSVADADPRIISNLIVNMTIENPAAVEAWFNNPLSLAAFEAAHPGITPLRPGETAVPGTSQVVTNADLATIPNQSPDIGLSPGFNAWMTFFGQFFDHGLDLVTKGNNGTVYIPLQPDDPLYVIGSPTNFMALTRATVTLDANGIPQHENTTTSFVDQNQTYTSHASHQVFLREYTRIDLPNDGPIGMKTVATGRLLDGQAANGSLDGAIGNWAEVKAQAITMLGLKLNDFDVHNVPLLKTDQYGKFIPGANGYAQVAVTVAETVGAVTTNYNFFIEGVAGGLDLHALPDPIGFVPTPGGTHTVTVIGTNHAFLNDIAHHAAPSIVDHDHDGGMVTPKIAQVADADLLDFNGDGVVNAADLAAGLGVIADADHDGDIDLSDLADVNLDGEINAADLIADDRNPLTYDDEMLNAHFVTGDGRGNENIALTAVHSIFHSEHNRLVDVNKQTIVQAAIDGDIAFLNEWLLVDVASVPADLSSLVWDGERLFQAARFVTEMQYQHLVFEEFARRVQPNVDPFIFTNSADVDPSILAEFAHVVYRFGHSMLTGTVDRLDNELQPVNGDADQATLLEAFLNPQMYIGTATDLAAVNGALIRGLTRDVGNEIDEFIVQDVRSNLLGLPLDLAALNISRGRDTGVPSLNLTRTQLYDDFGAADLKPYTSWVDFAQHIKNPMSVINFIAAYGTHASITDKVDDGLGGLREMTVAEKRDAAMELVLGTDINGGGVAGDRLAFLNATGSYSGGSLGGLNNVDLWIGGLAEEKNEFGGMLGSTFNFVFEYQMEHLQNGDRLYYLSRTQGTNLLNQLEPNSFTDLVMRNTDLGGLYSTHLNGALFVTPDYILELDPGIARDSADPIWDDPIHQALDPKVVRITGTDTSNVGTHVAGDGHYEGGTLKFSGGEHVVLGGTEGNDRLYSDKGIDTLWGDGGNDYLNAGMESDDVFGGDGDDIIEDPFGDDVLRGNKGNDVISGGVGVDLLFGDEGKDYIILGQDAAEAFAGTGDDFILGGVGKDFILGNEGDDWIEGGDGFDTLSGENSELFFNSSIIGHDVLWGQGNDQDYDAESGDDIMFSGPGIQRFEGMFGFDWAIAKFDPNGGKFDFQIPIFTNIPTDILKDRFDQVEGGSGWIHDDILDGDDRGHKGGGSSAPDSVPTELFTDHVLTQEGINRIAGLNDWFAGARVTLFGSAPGSNLTSYRDGNILMGGDGNDFLRGRGGYDIIDGDAWLNVRISIDMGGGILYSAESMNTDVTVAGSLAGKVMNAAGVVQFGGQSLNTLMLNGTINPGQLSIVREIKYDTTPNNNNDTAVFQGTLAEYDIEGRGIRLDLNGDGDFNDVGENVVQRAYDVDGDGFIFVRDRDNGAVGAVVDGVQLSSRGALTDDTDLLKNIELLRFADQTIAIAGTNRVATGTVTIADPTPYGGEVTPYVGQVLVPTLSGVGDPDGLTLAPNGLPVGLTFEWQTTEIGSNAGWSTIQTSDTYTVRTVDPGHILRAVAVFKDNAGVTERIFSNPTAGPTVAFSVNENSPTNTLVASSIPFSVDYDPLAINGAPPVDVDLTTLTHVLAPGGDAGGRFKIVQNGVDSNGSPIFQLLVANGGPVNLDFEAVQTPADNQYQIVIDSYSDATLTTLVVSRQFTVMLNDIVNEIAPTAIHWNGIRPAEAALPGSVAGEIIANLSSDIASTYALGAGSSPGFTVSAAGVVSRTGSAMLPTQTYSLVIVATGGGGSFSETFVIRTGANGVANVVNGTGLDDIVYGLSGNDTITTSSGDDTLFGQAGNDNLNGGVGNDLIIGGTGNDTVAGGVGNDTFHYAMGDGTDTIDGGSDSDTLVITGTSPGNDTLDVVFDGSGIVQIEGSGSITGVESVTADLLGNGAAGDTLSYGDNTNDGVTVNLSLGTASGFTSIANIENVSGGDGNDSLTGDANANTLNGNDGNDVLNGGLGGDVLNGENGNDTLVASVDNVRDLFNGNANTDTADYSAYSANLTVTTLGSAGGGIVVTGSGSSAANSDLLDSIENFTGGSGNDTVTGNGAANVIIGNAGKDVLTGSGGDDTLDGGADNDTLNGGDDNDTLIGGLGTNSLFGGNGTDTASYVTAAAAVTVSLAIAAQQNTLGAGQDTLNSIENLTGSTWNDTLTASGVQNVLNGGLGNDMLIATVDNLRDTLNGADGIDTANYSAYATGLTVNLGSAAPILVGGSGSNTNNSDVLQNIENFIGGSGGDTLTGNASANMLDGGLGNDTINYTLGGGADTIVGGGGTDTLNIIGTAADETLLVALTAGAISGFNGSSVTGAETITADLNGASDTLSYAGNAVAVAVNLLAGTATGFTSIADIANATGGDGVDTLTGDNNVNILDGGLLNDTLTGLGGNDTYLANNGDIIVEAAGGGTDLVRTATTSFTLANEVENLTFDNGAAADTAFNGTGNGSDNVITGGTAADTLLGLGGADTLNGAEGGDTLTGGGGNDAVNGGAGADTAVFSGPIGSYGFSLNGANLVVTDNRAGSPDGADTLNSIELVLFSTQTLELNFGSNGNNGINAGGGNDLVIGLNGNDDLDGQAGVDVLFGGAGADDFIFDDGETGVGVGNRDIIMDFSGGAGNDDIDLSDIDANTTVNNDQNFSFIGTSGFSDSNVSATLATGQIRYMQIDSDGVGGVDSTLIQGNVDNNLAVDFEILLQNYLGPLVATDFIL